MGSEIKTIPISGSDTVNELISQLRSSFSFTELEKLISERERSMSKKLTELQTTIEAVVKERYVLFRDNEKKGKLIDALTTANLEYKDQIKSFNPDKIRVLENELKAKEIEIRVLKKKNEDCERKVKVYKKRFSDLDERVLLLEEIAKDELKGFSTNLENFKQQKICASESSRPPLSSEKGDSNKKTEPKFKDIVKIDDDDDDDDDDDHDDDVRCPRRSKRKCISDSSDDDQFISTITTKKVSKETEKMCDDDKISAKNQKMKKLDKLNGQPVTCHPISTASSVETGPKNLLSDFKEGNKSVIPVSKERWECEDDMVNAFKKDDELCMNAVCALHRQKVPVKSYDLFSFVMLVNTLIDRDPEKKLKKRASELRAFSLEKCQTFAEDYSRDLFKIYQTKADLFFPGSSSKEKDVSI